MRPSELEHAAIVRVSPQELRPGRLGEIYRNGASAVILVGDERVPRLWSRVFGEAGVGAEFGLADWTSRILEVARNHRPGEVFLGDMLRFVPGGYAHAARKILVLPADGGGSLRAIPENFWSPRGCVALDEETRRIAWELMSEIRTSVLPARSEPEPGYAVRIEALQYLGSGEDLDRMCALLADSGGRWTRLGQRLDAHKASATGPFNRKVLRDLFAWGCLIPGIGASLRRLNGGPEGLDVAEHMRVIGRAHVDRSKELTALASDRDTIRTEIHDGRRWLELPLSPDSLAILPSTRIRDRLGKRPTLHRVLQVKPRPTPSIRPNATLSLAVLPRKGSRGLLRALRDPT